MRSWRRSGSSPGSRSTSSRTARFDQDPALLAELDIVVASVHSKLRMASSDMTPRMIAAIANPATDVLGHCTGRNVTRGDAGGKVRPESEFDAEIVFEACRQFGVAVEVNSRPERLDPPRRLLRLAVEMGCSFTIDTDAHAPGQLEWQVFGCARAEECEVPVERVVNTRFCGGHGGLGNTPGVEVVESSTTYERAWA